MESECLVEVRRGPIMESRHYGNVAVVNAEGKLLYYAGDPYRISYLRSSAKPLQSINAVISGAVDKFKFTDRELAIMCASHYGESFHQEVILGMLDKIGMKLSDLSCGAPPSISPEVREQQFRTNFKLDTYNCDCSGKHSGFLATCLTKGYPTADYNSPDHPLQKDVLSVLSYMFGVEEKDIYLGTDGCGVPVHAVPVYNMALGFAKLANPAGLKAGYPEACERIFKAMNANPDMIAGTHGFDTELIKNTHNKLICKLGAEGVMCIALKKQGLGLALKLEDGNTLRGFQQATMRALMDLEILDAQEIKALEQFITSPVLNNVGKPVGEIQAAYHLHKVCRQG